MLRTAGLLPGHCVRRASWREELSGFPKRVAPITSTSAASPAPAASGLPGAWGCPLESFNFPLTLWERGKQGVRA